MNDNSQFKGIFLPDLMPPAIGGVCSGYGFGRQGAKLFALECEPSSIPGSGSSFILES